MYLGHSDFYSYFLLAAPCPQHHHCYINQSPVEGASSLDVEPTAAAKMLVKDMTFKEGHEFKIRVRPNHGCNSFAINIGHDSENIALHFNPRFDSGSIICNSLSGGSWGDEQVDGLLPFSPGEECKFYINFNLQQFYIKLPDGSMMNFPNRLGDVKYKFFDVSGDARIVGIKIK